MIQPPVGRAKQRRVGLAVGLLTVATCLAILEGGVRFADWLRLGKPKTPPQELALFQENPAGTGSYRLRPNLDIETRDGASRIRIRTNSHGMHWRETAPLLSFEDLCVSFQPNRNFFMPGFWSRVPPAEVALRARDSVMDSLARMETLAAAQQARLAVVALPTSDQVYAREPSGRGFDTAFPQAHLEAFCQARRIPYLDLLPLLRRQAAASNRRLFLRRDIHLNNLGHARVGELIASWFQSRVVRQSAPAP